MPAIWVRAVSITAASASTVTVLCSPATVSAIARSNAEAHGERDRAHCLRESGMTHRDFIRPDLQIRQAEAPFAIRERGGGLVGFGAPRVDVRPGTTAPEGSVTRPLTLAKVMVSCAYAAAPPSIRIATMQTVRCFTVVPQIHCAQFQGTRATQSEPRPKGVVVPEYVTAIPKMTLREWK